MDPTNIRIQCYSSHTFHYYTFNFLEYLPANDGPREKLSLCAEVAEAQICAKGFLRESVFSSAAVFDNAVVLDTDETGLTILFKSERSARGAGL